MEDVSTKFKAWDYRIITMPLKSLLLKYKVNKIQFAIFFHFALQ